MNTTIQRFQSPLGLIRAAEQNGTVLFVGRDVASALGYAKPENAISQHVDLDDTLKQGITDSLGRTQETTLITESGVYALIFGSKLPGAKEFKKWVTSEVLPSIRKHGMYAKEDLLNNPDLLLSVITELKKEREDKERISKVNESLNETIQKQAPRVLFARAIETSNQSILIGELAKILQQNGIQIGQNRLFERLRSTGYLCRKGDFYNTPTQKAMELGLFEIKKVTITKADGTTLVTSTTKVTGKGQIYFVNHFLKSQPIQQN